MAISGGLALSTLFGIAILGAAVTGSPPAPARGGGLRSGAVPAAYESLVEQAGTVCPAFPAPVIAAQLEAESGFDPVAVSRAGAEGIAQFMPATWAVWGGDFDGSGSSSPFDPGDAIPAQAAYDCALAAQMAAALAAGTIAGAVTDLALAAYNAGPGAVLAAGGIPPIPQTEHYVAEIDAIAAEDTAPAGGGTGTSVPGFAAAEVAAAEAELGLPYVWGGGNTHGPTTGLAGVGPAGFDCSGLVLYAVFVASAGTLTLPHDSNLQGRMGEQVALGVGSTIRLGLLQPGDVIAFNLDGGSHYSHIGIYLGGGLLLHASHPGPGGGVKVESLTEAYWQPYTWSVRRYATASTPGPGGGPDPSGESMPDGTCPAGRRSSLTTSPGPP